MNFLKFSLLVAMVTIQIQRFGQNDMFPFLQLALKHYLDRINVHNQGNLI